MELLKSGEQPDYAVYAKDVVFSYDNKKNVVDHLTFSVKKGEIFGLLGPNGAGKTTTIKLMTTLLRPVSGELRILGMDYRSGNRLRSRLGVVLQDESFDFTTVERALDIYGYIWGVPRNIRKKRVNDLLEKFDLYDFRNKRMWDLSGGQKRRVQVAREFMHDMDLLFLDEPTTGLDPISRRKILDMIKDMSRNGLTVIFTTHILEEADYVCDRIAIMRSGKIVAMDKTEELKKRYAGAKTIEISLSKNRDRVLSMISTGEVSSDDNNDIIVTKDVNKTISEITELIKRFDASLEYINVRSVSLDDVFFNTINGEVS
ncbi:ABC transporter ATP-binding protein [Picrophilus oshimae]|uniref:ABC-2 type transport system ATP-binding protein n=1 Tax=Picrophilus torridus (strain ATCC 700027 / DSM 9790 / JCM 10055 / NBRC 100828 / KAW 2/3) TaxID=1122961 RepID=A0A8G2L8I0_PICTO|nr:ABC transporter ATP-binding protein [Picrophilus oshimae]SMD31470.1 ABC-2 type transport system ATP-binding protein [Picrophilus oshimae DSM 9789]